MKKDSAKLHFDPKQKAKATPAGSEKQDARPVGQFETTPKTSNGLGAKAR